MPAATFQATGLDAGPGNYVSPEVVTPERMEVIDDPIEALRVAGVELRVLDRLGPLRGTWASTLHTSGFRLRNAQGWAEPGTGTR